MISATSLAFSSAILHASWNFLVKRVGSPRASTLLTLSFAMVFAIAALLVTQTWSGPLVYRWILMAGLGEALYVTSLGIAMDRGDLGVTYAASRATAMVAIWPLSFLCFRTVPGPYALLATAFVLVGIFFCRPQKRVDGSGVESRFALAPTLASGVSVGIYHCGYKGSVNAGTATPLTFAAALVVALPILWLVVGRTVFPDVRSLVRRRLVLLVLSGAGACGSFLLAVYALERSGSGRVLGLRNSSVGIALLLALFLGERPSRRQWGGIACLGASIPLFSVEP